MNQHIPDYKVYEDKYCQGYIGILKKCKRYNQYLKAILKPGGIRPQKRVANDAHQHESMYSEGSRKLRLCECLIRKSQTGRKLGYSEQRRPTAIAESSIDPLDNEGLKAKSSDILNKEPTRHYWGRHRVECRDTSLSGH